jgi:hypothetical protein
MEAPASISDPAVVQRFRALLDAFDDAERALGGTGVYAAEGEDRTPRSRLVVIGDQSHGTLPTSPRLH